MTVSPAVCNVSGLPLLLVHLHHHAPTIRRKYARQLEEQQLAALLGGNATAEAQQGRTKDDRTQERERELRRE